MLCVSSACRPEATRQRAIPSSPISRTRPSIPAVVAAGAGEVGAVAGVDPAGEAGAAVGADPAAGVVVGVAVSPPPITAPVVRRLLNSSPAMSWDGPCAAMGAEIVFLVYGHILFSKTV
ncbi:hypothetical protein GFGA_1d0952 [Gluconobacter frateurii NBRC 103465]|nr:hypothetical protein GFGA_1d0952 [Gluconobacter frateurii NBRC 103465]